MEKLHSGPGGELHKFVAHVTLTHGEMMLDALDRERVDQIPNVNFLPVHRKVGDPTSRSVVARVGVIYDVGAQHQQLLGVLIQVADRDRLRGENLVT